MIWVNSDLGSDQTDRSVSVPCRGIDNEVRGLPSSDMSKLTAATTSATIASTTIAARKDL